jgi:hypothetical protein
MADYPHGFEIYHATLKFGDIDDKAFARVLQFLADYQLGGLYDYDARKREIRLRYTTPEFVEYMARKTGVKPMEARYTAVFEYRLPAD